MPFTIDGNWIPNESSHPPSSSKPVKVRKVKKKNVIVTVIYNLNPKTHNLKEIAASLKRKLGVGGSIKNENIELQGDKVSEVEAFLRGLGIKTN